MSHWRNRARDVIQRTLADLRATNPEATEREKRAALAAAYPFGEREMWPYKCWLAEVRKAMGGKARPKGDEYDLPIFANGREGEE